MKLMKAISSLGLIVLLAGGSVEAGVPVAPDLEITATRETISATTPMRSTTPSDLKAALISGADYLVAMQADITEDNAGNGTDGVDETPDDPDDGGWDWSVKSPPNPVSHTTSTSPDNIYGATAIGLYYAYLVTGDAAHLTALKDTADGMLARSTVDGGRDFTFLLLFNDLPAVLGTAYADTAKARYDAKIAASGGAESVAIGIRDGRAGQGYENGIIPWDIGLWVEAAAMLDERYGGYASDADDMAEVIYDDTYLGLPGYFDLDDNAGWDPTYANVDYYWYNIGVSGIFNAFVSADVHTSELPALADTLLSSQFPSGAISYSYGANTDDEDWQSTAYAAMALALYDYPGYKTEIVSMGSWLDDTQDDALTGGWRYSSDNHYPEICGENTAALYFAYLAVNNVAAEPSGDCLSIDNTCETVSVNFNRADSEDARGVSVTFELSGLELCVDEATSISRGTWLDGFSWIFDTIDHGGGIYTVDQSISGACPGQPTGGELFTLDVKTAGTDGTGTITVTEVKVRDCTNNPLPGVAGAVGEITIDTVKPVAVSTLTAAQVLSGNDTDGTTKINVTFTAPGDAASVEVYRKGFGDYPEYDDGTGAPVTAPASYPPDGTWTLTGVTATGQDDEPALRDYWYYVVYSEDDCGNVSLVSNLAGGTLNYHLGDVTPAGPPWNNNVDGQDVSALGAAYGETDGGPFYNAHADVGPTTTMYVDGLPTTDDSIDFEDLIMFAINFGVVGRAPGTPEEALMNERPVLALVQNAPSGDVVTARLMLRGNDLAVKGIHSVIQFDPEAMELLSVSEGRLLEEQGGTVFFKSLDREAGVIVDAALLGRELTIAGSGEVATLRFRTLEPGAHAALVVSDLRDRRNRPLGMDVIATQPGREAAPSRLELVGARPNPFGTSTEIVFRLPAATPVSLRIYDVAGRLVQTLADETMAPGEHTVTWDGRSASGHHTVTGIYFYTFRTPVLEETRKLFRTQ